MKKLSEVFREMEAAELRRTVLSAEHLQDVLDGPEQECYPIELAHHVTDPAHGGKVVCHKCNGFIVAAEHIGYHCYQNAREFPKAHFHKACYNQYEHYYGLDKPID